MVRKVKGRRTSALLYLTLAALAVALYGASCGDDNGNNTGSPGTGETRFSGDVTSVQPAAVAAREAGARRLAFRWPAIPARAFAQGACPAPSSGGMLLFCVRSASTESCQPVNSSSCGFELSMVIAGGATPLDLVFVDDANNTGQPDGSEATSEVVQSLVFCNGDQVSVANAAVNFTTGATTASVTKTFNACASAGPTRTPGSGGNGTRTPTPHSHATTTPNPHASATPTPMPGGNPTSTPTRTRTPTPTPTDYGYGTSLNPSPSRALAFLLSAGALALLVPRRRK